jgi:hypothetical protein
MLLVKDILDVAGLVRVLTDRDEDFATVEDLEAIADHAGLWSEAALDEADELDPYNVCRRALLMILRRSGRTADGRVVRWLTVVRENEFSGRRRRLYKLEELGTAEDFLESVASLTEQAAERVREAERIRRRLEVKFRREVADDDE